MTDHGIMSKPKKRTVFGPHLDRNCQAKIKLFRNTPDYGINHVWHGFPTIRGYLLGQKADSFRSAVEHTKLLPFKQVSSEVSEEIGGMLPSPPTFSDRRRAKKADSFWSAPMSDKMPIFLGFRGVCQEF